MWSRSSSCLGRGVAATLRIATLCLLSRAAHCAPLEGGVGGRGSPPTLGARKRPLMSSVAKGRHQGREHVLMRREGHADASAHGAIVDEESAQTVAKDERSRRSSRRGVVKDAPAGLGSAQLRMRQQPTVHRAASYVEIGPHASVAGREPAEKAPSVGRKARKATKGEQPPQLQEEQRATWTDMTENLKAVLGDKDTNKCPDGATHIVDPDLCFQAAGNLSYEWSANSVEADSSYPTGCYGNNNVAWFNEDGTGKAELLSRPICVSEVDATTNASKTIGKATPGNDSESGNAQGPTDNAVGGIGSGADYTFDHVGHCAAGWDGAAKRETTIGACAANCRSSSTCGYFGYDDASTSGDNCALYDVAGGCPNDGQFPSFNSYRMAAQADYTWDHDGHCAAGFSGSSSRENTISDCASKCRGSSDCGYFAYDGVTSTGANCALFDVAGGCPDDDLYPTYNSFRIVAQADYTFDHDGHCGAGLQDSTREDSISECASQCRSNTDCGYFAWNGGDSSSEKNCALYTLAGGCPDDHHYPEFNAYRMVAQATMVSSSGSQVSSHVGSHTETAAASSTAASTSSGPKCSTFICPLGFHYKKGAGDIVCQGHYDGDACQSDVDTKNCCDETYAGVLTEVFFMPTSGHLPDLTDHTPDVKRVDVQVNFPGDDSSQVSRSTVFRFTGQLRITNQGMYSFRLTSKDGSRLSLDGSSTLLIDNDGKRDDVKTAIGGQTLRSGMHPFQIDYFTVSGIHIVWEYSGPDSAGFWEIVPQDVLYEPPAFCCSMECPKDKQLIEDSTHVVCLAKPCDPHMDEARCCESPNSFRNMLKHGDSHQNSSYFPQSGCTSASPSTAAMLIAMMMMLKVTLRE